MTQYENLNIPLGDGFHLESAYIGWDSPTTPYRLTFMEDVTGFEVEVARDKYPYTSYDHPLMQLTFDAWLERVADAICRLKPVPLIDHVKPIKDRDVDWHEHAWAILVDYIRTYHDGQ